MRSRDIFRNGSIWNNCVTASPYLSKEEEHFLEMCRKAGVEAKIQETNEQGRVYSVLFKPEYLDDLEQKVVEFCKKNNIKYSFYRDIDGMHHYNFSKLVAFEQDGTETNVKLVSYDEILSRYQSKNVPIKVEPKRWWEKILAKFGFVRVIKPKPKTEYDYFLESIGYTEETLDKLKKLALPEEEPPRRPKYG